ncbi:hypothetical protein AURANDRAFT_1424, partial [Aureococcus anophagefferens]
VVWLLALVYCFLGVAIVSDVFMAAIERITSDEKTVTRDVMVNGRTVKRTFHVRVWNATIANLTLMALGSSAPEILLSIIEIVGNDFYSGDLGPSTIVGSAAFNLMIILAVCVAAIPDGESRRINDFEVFQVTAVFSVFAYLWLLFILVVNTPDYCDVWEAPRALVVVRTQGCVGAVACKYATRDGSACAGGDYVAASGALEFADGEVAKRLDVEIVDDAEVEAHSETFFVDLTDATGGATFDATWDGGEDRAVATVVIIDDTDRRGLAGLLIPLINRDKLNLALNDYKSQFRDAVALEGDAPTPGDYAMHVLALPWKVCFACIPPPSYGGGWVCFFVALVYIGGLTLVIGEVATLLGSALGIADSVTAITFVALGTSLPDTFASKTAATADPYADAAVGNVTGSNSVNVFLGLGLPWARKDGAWDHVGFLVPAGSLGVSVTTFSACACATLVVLVLRRKLLGAELGGPRAAKHATAALFVCLWLVYIVVSTSKAYGWI